MLKEGIKLELTRNPTATCRGLSATYGLDKDFIGKLLNELYSEKVERIRQVDLSEELKRFENSYLFLIGRTMSLLEMTKSESIQLGAIRTVADLCKTLFNTKTLCTADAPYGDDGERPLTYSEALSMLSNHEKGGTKPNDV